MVFSGLVEEMGEVLTFVQNKKTEQWILTIKAKEVIADCKLGDSIAVNGVCLTVTEFDQAKGFFVVGLSPETLRRTNLGLLKPKDLVNLERSLAANGRVGGHFVQGHVDGVGKIKSMRREKDSLWVTVETSPDLMKLIVEKGYITVDGTSLTVCEVTETYFTFMLIQYTQEKVIISRKQPGDIVNLEPDVLGKYIMRYFENYEAQRAKMASKL